MSSMKKFLWCVGTLLLGGVGVMYADDSTRLKTLEKNLADLTREVNTLKAEKMDMEPRRNSAKDDPRQRGIFMGGYGEFVYEKIPFRRKLWALIS